MLNVDEPLADGCMGATEVAFKIRKRYQTNELIVDSTEFGTRGSEVQILSPRPSFLSLFQLFTRPFALQLFRRFSVHSVQPKAIRSRIRTSLPTSCGTERPL